MHGCNSCVWSTKPAVPATPRHRRVGDNPNLEDGSIWATSVSVSQLGAVNEQEWGVNQPPELVLSKCIDKYMLNEAALAFQSLLVFCLGGAAQTDSREKFARMKIPPSKSNQVFRWPAGWILIRAVACSQRHSCFCSSMMQQPACPLQG